MVADRRARGRDDVTILQLALAVISGLSSGQEIARRRVDATVVLARYEEDCSRILLYPRCRFVVYNKGSPLPPEYARA